MKGDKHVDHVLSICTGIGGLDLGFSGGLRSIGRTPRTVCYVEREAFPCACLAKAIESRWMDDAPVWLGDLKGLPLGNLPRIDWIIGGYPCQPYSASGRRRGKQDERHLWPAIMQLVRKFRPSGMLFENVAGHITLGLFDVLSDLEEGGYRTTWGVFSAEEVGAPHGRERVFILALADTDSERGRLRNAEREDAKDARKSPVGAWPSRPGEPGKLWEAFRTTQRGLGRATDGLPDRVDRLRALGNAVVPQTAERAFTQLWRELQ